MPVFPAHLLHPASVKRSLTGRVISSPPSLSGVTQSIRTDGGGLWQVTYGGIILRTTDQRRIWGAWDSYLAGGVQRVKVPMIANLDAPRGVQGGRTARYGGLAFTGDPYFPDAVNYASALVVATASAADLRATTLTINVTRGVDPKGSEIFGIRYADGTDRAHRIVRALGGSQYSIDPPLRQAIENDTSLNFDWALVDATVAPGADIAPEYSNGRGEVSITFQEAIDDVAA